MKKPNAVELILALHKADGTEPIGRLPGLWERKIDERWTIWVNGHLEPLSLRDGDGLRIQPGDCYVEYNGWPAGLFSLVHGDGTFASGSQGNYRNFCKALAKANSDKPPVPLRKT